jgi:hypothetical protein
LNGKITIIFPSDYTKIPSFTSTSVLINNAAPGNGNPGYTITSTLALNLQVSVEGAFSATGVGANVRIVITLRGIKNPTKIGTTGGFTVTT